MNRNNFACKHHKMHIITTIVMTRTHIYNMRILTYRLTDIHNSDESIRDLLKIETSLIEYFSESSDLFQYNCTRER